MKKKKTPSTRKALTKRTVLARAKKIRMILMDVDGVLTDGRILLFDNHREIKSFDVKDGVAIHMARRAGLLTGVITGRSSEAVRLRAKELKFDEVHQNALDKLPVYQEILARHSLLDEEVCYMGDDWVDIPLLRRVGFAVVPADADPEAKKQAHLQTRSAGGHGVVRETVDIILRAQGKRDSILSRYLDRSTDGTGRKRAGGTR